MKTIPWRFYFRLTLAVGLIPGFAVGNSLAKAMKSPMSGLVVGVLFGALCILWTTIWYLRVMRRRDPAFTLAEASPNCDATFELPVAADDAYDLCLEVLDGMPAFYATVNDRAALRIEGGTGGGNAGYLSFGAPGERISVEVAARGATYAHVRVRSRPGAMFVLLDFGKNRENLKTISKHLNFAIQQRYLLEREAAERAEMQRALTQAKLSALEAHIEPHFLYNTLANAQLLTRSDPKRADEMLGNLITYLRNALPQAEASSSTLGRELERSQAYLEILKIRMGARLNVEIAVPAALGATPFPPMMLQTLVENAVKHGLEPKSGGGRIVIEAGVTAQRLILTVADNGLGLREGTAGSGLGLKNIRERLKLSYGDAAELMLASNAPQGLVAKISLPISLPASWPPALPHAVQG